MQQTAASLGVDAKAYRRIFAPLVNDAEALIPAVLGTLLKPPSHPLAMARFGVLGLLPVTTLARSLKTDSARALLAGLGAHSMRPLSAPGTSAFGLLLGILAHAVGWPVVEGGSARIVDALVAELTAAGGVVHTGHWIADLEELPRAKATLLDVAPRQLLELAGEGLPSRYRSALGRFRYGPGICKVDWALDGPVPWEAEPCRITATIHVGGTLEQIAAGESEVARGRHPERPFCIAVQPCVLDPLARPRAPNLLCLLSCSRPLSL